MAGYVIHRAGAGVQPELLASGVLCLRLRFEDGERTEPRGFTPPIGGLSVGARAPEPRLVREVAGPSAQGPLQGPSW